MSESKSGSSEQTLYQEVHRRFVLTGEWDRIIAVLSQKLNESGWTDEIRHRGKEAARNSEPPKFNVIFDQVEAHGSASVPPAIKQEVTNLITRFLEKEFQS